MILAIILIIFGLVFVYGSAFAIKDKERGDAALAMFLSFIFVAFSFVVLYDDAKETNVKNTKEVTLQLLKKDNKVDIQIDSNYSDLNYTLLDSSLTNVFKYLKNN